MRHASRTIAVFMVCCLVWSSDLPGQTSKAKKTPASGTKTVRPIHLDLFSLQVSKLPRDDFGHGIKPGTNENVTNWLANSGTVVDLRLKLDRPILRFDEQASRIVHFADDKDRDLTSEPGLHRVNTFFPDNKPIVVKVGPEPDEAEVILRAFGVPAPGGTKLDIHADLVFLSGSGEQTVERKDLEPTPGKSATIGPLHLLFHDPQQAPRFGPRRLGPRFDDQKTMEVAFEYKPMMKPIKSLACLDPDGRQVAYLEGRSFNVEHGGTYTFTMPRMARIHLRVAYFEKSETITVPILLQTGVGF